MKYRKCDIEESNMEDTKVLVNNLDKSVHVLNATAAKIYEFVNDNDIEDIVDKMKQIYETVDRETLKKDITNVLLELEEKKLIETL